MPRFKLQVILVDRVHHLAHCTTPNGCILPSSVRLCILSTSCSCEAFRQKREEVVQEVLRARTRHWDNAARHLWKTCQVWVTVLVRCAKVCKCTCLQMFASFRARDIVKPDDQVITATEDPVENVAAAMTIRAAVLGLRQRIVISD